MSAPTPPWEQYCYTVGQAARLVGKSRQALYIEIDAGRLPTHRPHPKADHVILTEDLKRWMRGEYANGYTIAKEAAS